MPFGGNLAYRRKNCDGPVPSLGGAERDYPCYYQWGVDPNRNYGEGWGGPGASPDPNTQVYRGDDQWSEPETQAVHEYSQTHPVTTMITLHNVAALVLRPPGLHTAGKAPDEDMLKAARRRDGRRHRLHVAVRLRALRHLGHDRGLELRRARARSATRSRSARRAASSTCRTRPASSSSGSARTRTRRPGQPAQGRHAPGAARRPRRQPPTRPSTRSSRARRPPAACCVCRSRSRRSRARSARSRRATSARARSRRPTASLPARSAARPTSSSTRPSCRKDGTLQLARHAVDASVRRRQERRGRGDQPRDDVHRRRPGQRPGAGRDEGVRLRRPGLGLHAQPRHQAVVDRGAGGLRPLPLLRHARRQEASRSARDRWSTGS